MPGCFCSWVKSATHRWVARRSGMVCTVCSCTDDVSWRWDVDWAVWYAVSTYVDRTDQPLQQTAPLLCATGGQQQQFHNSNSIGTVLRLVSSHVLVVLSRGAGPQRPKHVTPLAQQLHSTASYHLLARYTSTTQLSMRCHCILGQSRLNNHQFCKDNTNCNQHHPASSE